MNGRIFYINFVLIIKCLSAATLGPNLLINHDFSIPDLTAQRAIYEVFDSPILGWNCSGYCEINNCFQFNKYALESHSWNGYSGDCPLQAIDTNSYTIDVISQLFLTQAGQHFLEIKFLLPILYSSKKSFVLMINDERIYEYYSPIPAFNHIEASMKIMLKEGFNNVSFKSEGLNDGMGFRIFDIRIRRIILPQIDNLIAITTGSNTLLANMVSIPCSRIIFGELINIALSFDRMQLYYYHHRRYSYYYQTFLKGVTALLNQKGTYATYLSDMFFLSIGTSQQSILKVINYKKGRKYKDGFDKSNFVENGGFFFMFSSIPITLIIFFTFYALFNITVNNKFSKFIRKYSFFPLILMMLFEGNIEQFSFLIIDQFLEYFSSSFMHKIINFAISIIFYIIIFCSTVFYLYCWQGYSKKMSYLTDNISTNLSGIIAYTFDRGLICLVLGLTHRLTLLFGKNQLVILAAVQLSFIASKTIFLIRTAYKCKKLGWLSIIQGFIRICFQISIFIYEDSEDLSGFINEGIHLKIIYMFLFIWTLNLIFSIIGMISQQLSQKQQKMNEKKSETNSTVFIRQKSFKQTMNIVKVKIQIKNDGQQWSYVKYADSLNIQI